MNVSGTVVERSGAIPSTITFKTNTVLYNWPDGVVGYHVSLTPIRSWDRAPVWSFLFAVFHSAPGICGYLLFAKTLSSVVAAWFIIAGRESGSWCSGFI